jgi:hypothetical protein
VRLSFAKKAAKSDRNKENHPKPEAFYSEAAKKLIKTISFDKDDKISREELLEFYKKNPQGK